MNIFKNLPIPVGVGPGADIDVSDLGKDKTIVVGGAFNGNTVLIEISTDAAGLFFHPIAMFTAAGHKTLPVAARRMRVNVGGSLPVGLNVDVGADDQGALFVDLPMPVGNGAGAAVDISAFGDWITAVVAGAMGGSTTIEISEDGVDFHNLCPSFTAPGTSSQLATANWARTFVRNGTGAATSVSLGAIKGAVTQANAGAVERSLYSDVIASTSGAEFIDGMAGASIAVPVDGEYWAIWEGEHRLTNDDTGIEVGISVNSIVAVVAGSERKIVGPLGSKDKPFVTTVSLGALVAGDLVRGLYRRSAGVGGQTATLRRRNLSIFKVIL
jgi:hypothetical protein